MVLDRTLQIHREEAVIGNVEIAAFIYQTRIMQSVPLIAVSVVIMVHGVLQSLIAIKYFMDCPLSEHRNQTVKNAMEIIDSKNVTQRTVDAQSLDMVARYIALLVARDAHARI